MTRHAVPTGMSVLGSVLRLIDSRRSGWRHPEGTMHRV